MIKKEKIVNGIIVLTQDFSFDVENRLVSVTEGTNITRFEYNEGEERLVKSDSATGKTTYYYFENYEETWTKDGDYIERESMKYYFVNNIRVAQRSLTTSLENEEEKVLYNHADHLGSAVRMTDVNGDSVHSMAYEPFGKTWYNAGTEEPRYQFTNQENDKSIGLYYYGARYYDPEIGRFISADTVLDGLNRYAYCGNNPIKYNDPSGHNIATRYIPEGASNNDLYEEGPAGDSYTEKSPLYRKSVKINEDRLKISYIGQNGEDIPILNIDYKNKELKYYSHNAEEIYDYRGIQEGYIRYSKWAKNVLDRLNPFFSVDGAATGGFVLKNGKWEFVPDQLCGGTLTFDISFGPFAGGMAIPGVYEGIEGLVYGKPQTPTLSQSMEDLLMLTSADNNKESASDKVRDHDKNIDEDTVSETKDLASASDTKRASEARDRAEALREASEAKDMLDTLAHIVKNILKGK